MNQWINFIKGDGKGFYSKVGKFFAKTRFANSLVDKYGPSNIVNTPCQCSICGVWKKSFQAVSVHMITHGVKNPMRRYVGSETHCIWCLKTFWTRERMINVHLRRSKVCRNMHLLHEPYYSQDESNRFDDCDKEAHVALQRAGHRRHKAMFPCIRLHGPLPLVLTTAPSDHHPLGRGHNYHNVG